MTKLSLLYKKILTFFIFIISLIIFNLTLSNNSALKQASTFFLISSCTGLVYHGPKYQN